MNKRIISLLCLLIIIIFVAIWGISKSQEVMTGAQGVIRTELSTALGSAVTVGDIELTSYDTITIHNTVIYDKETNPLFSSEKISVTYSPLVILRGQAAAEAISHIEVHQPILHLSQAGDGRWNVQELFKQENTQSSSFIGKIKLVNGSGSISSAGSTWILENLNGDVNFSNKPTVDLKLQALNKGATLLVEGSINREKRSHLHIKASELSLVDYQKFLPESSLDLIGGSLKQLDVTVTENQAAIEWAGSADLA